MKRCLSLRFFPFYVLFYLLHQIFLRRRKTQTYNLDSIRIYFSRISSNFSFHPSQLGRNWLKGAWHKLLPNQRKGKCAKISGTKITWLCSERISGCSSAALGFTSCRIFVSSHPSHLFRSCEAVKTFLHFLQNWLENCACEELPQLAQLDTVSLDQSLLWNGALLLWLFLQFGNLSLWSNPFAA